MCLFCLFGCFDVTKIDSLSYSTFQWFVFSYVLLKNILIYFTTGLQWVLLCRYRCIDSLQHASQCKDANCKQSVCEKMKRVVSHTKMCKVMLSNISSPQFLSEPINYPAIYCWVISIGRVVFYGWNLLIFPLLGYFLKDVSELGGWLSGRFTLLY